MPSPATKSRPRKRPVQRTASGSSTRIEAPPRRRMGVEERRSQLIELGVEAFSLRPYDAVSIDDVAATAGISKGLLYHYFPTKRDFYVATIGEVSRHLLDATDIADGDDPVLRLRRGLDAYFQFVERHGAAYASLLRGGIGVDPEAAAVVENTRTIIAKRLLASIELGEVSPLVRTTIRGWIGFVEATSLDWVDHHDVSQSDLVVLWQRTLVIMIAEHVQRR